jgi:PKD repeat protein
MNHPTTHNKWIARLCAGAVLAVILWGGGNCVTEAVVPVGGIASDFTIVNHKTGQPLRLSDYRGSIIVLEFWAYWCGSCDAATADVIPNVFLYYRNRGGNNHGLPVTLISISVDNSNRSAVNSVIAKYGLELVGDDDEDVAYDQFGTSRVIPHFVVINGVANSSTHRLWQVAHNRVDYSRTAIKSAIDSIGARAAVPPAAVFTATPTNGFAPLTVTFTDTSTGDITKRGWNFGDGFTTNTSSTTLSHTFGIGAFSVRLTASGPAGTNSVTKLITGRCGNTVTTSSSPANGGTISGGGTVPCGTAVTVSATAVSACYQFLNWTEGGSNVSANASYTFTANTNRNLVANFSQSSSTIDTAATPPTVGTVSGGGTKGCGSSVTVVATATNSCYRFVNWTEGGAVVSANASYTFTASADRSLVANFALITYNITTSPFPTNGGNTSGDGTVDCSSSATVSATANSCYRFVSWTEGGAVVSTNATYTFIASSNRNLAANFALITHHIAMSSLPTGGGITKGGGTVYCSSSATVSATANSCYQFVNWTEDGAVVSTNVSYTFTVSTNRNLTANFAPLTSTVATSAAPTGGGNTSGGGTVNCGSSATVCATPATCHQFVNWTDGGSVVSTNACYTFTVSTNRNLTANFAPLTPTVATSSLPTGGGTTSGGGAVNCGSEVTVCATTNACHQFVNWTEGGTPVSSTPCYTFTASTNRNLVANFTHISYAIATTASPAQGGATSGGGPDIPCGSEVTLVATPNSHYAFTNWTENGTVTSGAARYTFTANGDRNLVANFVVVPNRAPNFTCAPTITNALLQTGASFVVAAGDTNIFRVCAIDSEQDPLSYQWLFGNGDSTAWLPATTAAYAYPATNCGPFTARVTVSDGELTISSNLLVTVACELNVTNKGTKVQAKLNFAKPASDSCKVTVIPQPGQCTNWLGVAVTLDVGGAKVSWTLDAKGRGQNANGKCQFKFNKKTGLCAFTASLQSGTWRDAWAAYGLTDETVGKPGRRVKLPVVLLIGNEAFASEAALTYTAQEKKSGTAK